MTTPDRDDVTDAHEGSNALADTRRPVNFAVPAPSRRYSALGGNAKDALPADRESARILAEAFPGIGAAVAANRAFVRRAVRCLCAEYGIRQFLDIGAGLPDAPNVHEVAQLVAPEARVVYVDNDPVVMTRARALLTGNPRGRTSYIEADLRDPDRILTDPQLRETFDDSRPIAALLFAVLHFIDEEDDPITAVRRLMDGLPAGSFVALSHVTFDPPLPEDVAANLTELAKPGAGHGTFRPRTYQEVARFLHGLEILDPGIVLTVNWRPDDQPPVVAQADAASYAAVARKP